MNKPARITIVAALLGLVCACSSDKDKAELRVCPRAGILLDAADMIQFAPGEGRGINDVAYDVEVSNIGTSCKYKDNKIKSKITFDADMWAGRAAPLGKKQFRYFVAVTELNTSIVTKQYFTIEADFSKTSRVYKHQDVGDITIDFSKLGRADLYEILIGWDLTPEQLQYNRTTTPFDRPNIKDYPGR